MSCWTQDFSVIKDFDTRTRWLDITEFYDCLALDPCCSCDVCPKDRMFYVIGDVFTYNFINEVNTVKIINPIDDAEIADKTGDWKSGDKQITIDTSDTAGASCFIVKINDDCCLCFVFEELVCTDNSFTIESTPLNATDCFGNKYDGSFSNLMRIKGTALHKNYQTESEVNQDNELKYTSVRQLFNIESHQYYEQDGYLLRLLQEVILQGNDITITFLDGTVKVFDFYNGSGLSSETPDFSSQWLPKFVLRTQACEDYIRCN